MSDSRIASITVAFNPDVSRLSQQLSLLLAQVEFLIVVDNGSSRPWREELADPAVLSRLCVVALSANRGIAGGINAGLNAARAMGAQFALCMDHDSIAPAGCVDALHAGLLEVEGAGQKIAAVGPIISDLRDHRQSPFIRLGWLRHRHQFCSPNAAPIETDFLITSGCFARLSAYDSVDGVGPLEDGLFIDSVDFEWCCRARAKGFALYGICAAVLDHRLGDSRRRILFGYSMIVHSPDRLYYMTRNRIALYGRSYVPMRWKNKDVFRMVLKLVITLVFLSPRRIYLSRSFAALKDALAKRYGPRV